MLADRDRDADAVAIAAAPLGALAAGIENRATLVELGAVQLLARALVVVVAANDGDAVEVVLGALRRFAMDHAPATTMREHVELRAAVAAVLDRTEEEDVREWAAAKRAARELEARLRRLSDARELARELGFVVVDGVSGTVAATGRQGGSVDPLERERERES